MIEELLALTLSLAAASAVYWSWLHRPRPWLALSGWTLALLSPLAWSRALGPEFGVSYAIIVFICLAWALVVLNTRVSGKAGRSPQRPFRPLSMPEPSVLLHHAALFFLSVPVTGVLAMMITVALLILLPWTLLTKVAVAVFLYPLLWGALSSWVCAQQSPVRPALVIAGLSVFSSLVLFA